MWVALAILWSLFWIYSCGSGFVALGEDPELGDTAKGIGGMVVLFFNGGIWLGGIVGLAMLKFLFGYIAKPQEPK